MENLVYVALKQLPSYVFKTIKITIVCVYIELRVYKNRKNVEVNLRTSI